jgi:hypothetical protein
MTAGRSTPAGSTPTAGEPRSIALAAYLRRTAAVFSMSADVTNSARTAEAGMALLDAAEVAEAIPAGDARIRILSEAGLFESMPQGGAVFVESPEIRRSVRRPLVASHEGGTAIIAGLVATAEALDRHAGARRPGRGLSGEAPPPIPLHLLSDAVRVARLRLRGLRPRVTPTEVARAREDLILALESYVDALELWSFPVPYTLRSELRLHRGLLGY